MEVKIFNNGSQPTPEYKHKGDSGMDIRANEDVILYPFETGRMVKTGIHVKIPRGYEIQVRPRSGMSHSTKLRVSNSPGTIDSNYIGELCILCDNIGNDRIEIKTGDRIAQIVLCPVEEIEWSSVESKDDLEVTTRGADGFGSTGKQ